jgi:hypothetical protein
MGGKGGGGSISVPQNPYEQSLANIAMGIYNQTQGMRNVLTDQAGAFLRGRMSPRDMPQFGPLYALSRQGLESQYNVAKDQLMSTMPKGGTLRAGLSDLAVNRASQVGMLPNQIGSSLVGDLQNKIYGTAWGTPSQSMSGFGSAASGWSSRANTAAMIEAQQQQASNSAWGGLGRGIGSFFFGDGKK